MDEMRRFNIRISPEVYEYFKNRSEKTGVAMSALMFLMLEKGVREEQFLDSELPELIKQAQAKGIL